MDVSDVCKFNYILHSNCKAKLAHNQLAKADYVNITWLTLAKVTYLNSLSCLVIHKSPLASSKTASQGALLCFDNTDFVSGFVFADTVVGAVAYWTFGVPCSVYLLDSPDVQVLQSTDLSIPGHG